ncbi:phage recombination protein Bet [Leucobacter luti]|uniref:phage recombination protein Bet n=1 Tax=Leucobacter luti TaxID=340320 RepID=UPI003CFD2CD4
MSTAVAERESAGTNLVLAAEQTFFNEAQQAALVQMGLGSAPRGDIETFFHQAKRSGLDPFARQIYMIERRSKVRGEWVTKYTIQTSIDGFRVIRDRKGTFRGMEEHWCGTDGVWREVWLEQRPPAAARITLYLDGFVKPVTAVARYDEYVPLRDGKPTGQWGKMPALMTSKVAEALALRKAYPQDFSGLYTADEMAQAENAPAAQAPAQRPTPAPAPAHAEPDPVAAEEEPVEAEIAFDGAAWIERIQAALAAEPNERGIEMLRALHGEARAEGLLSEVLVEDMTLNHVLRASKSEIEARP